MKAQELARLLRQGEAPQVIDVRSGFEYRTGHIPGALHLPMFKLMLRLARLPADREAPYLLTCEHGPRAMLVQGLMERRGYTRVALLDGHMHGWRRLGLPLEK